MSGGRTRRRSLRVPLDEVPRNAEATRAEAQPVEAATKPATIPPPARPRTMPPPPPRESLDSLDARGASDAARKTDPGSSIESLDLAPGELLSDDELGKPVESSMELDAMELDSEPTTLLRQDDPHAAASLGVTAPSAAGLGVFGDEPPLDDVRATSEMLVVPAVEPEPQREEPSQILEVAEDASEPEVAGAEPAPLASPPKPRSEPPAAKTEPPPRPSLPPEPGSTPGVIMVQRTIAIGVGAPTHTTTAIERESAPPQSEPAFEISESEIDPTGELELRESTPGDAPTSATEASSEVGEEHGEELEELDVEADARHPRSAPPPPPGGAAAPPPPPREANRPPPPPKVPATPAAPPPAVPAMDAETGKRARKKWWEEFFNDDYFRTVPFPQPKTIVAQSAFIAARLGLPPGATILDVGCGLGLHAIELTRMGYNVVALDLSLPMLSRAADEAQDQGLKINFIQADMREMAFESMFDAVLCWGTTFGYFDDDQNRLVIERLHRALKPGGLLLLDVVNRDYVVRVTPNSCWFQGDGCVVMEETNCNYINSRLTVKRQVMLDDGRQVETVYTIRLYSLHELGQILHQRGFRVVEVSGREATPAVFFGADSPQLLIVAQRRADVPTPSTPPKRLDEGSSGDSQQMVAAREPKPEPEAKPAAVAEAAEVAPAAEPAPAEPENEPLTLEPDSDPETPA